MYSGNENNFLLWKSSYTFISLHLNMLFSTCKCVLLPTSFSYSNIKSSTLRNILYQGEMVYFSEYFNYSFTNPYTHFVEQFVNVIHCFRFKFQMTRFGFFFLVYLYIQYFTFHVLFFFLVKKAITIFYFLSFDA